MKINDLIHEDIKARNVIGSAVRVDEIPLKYREKYKMIGRGSTSLIYQYDDNNVLVFTRDKMKEEWIKIILKMSEYIEEFDVRGISHIRGMSDIPIIVFKMPMLYPLNKENYKLVKQEIDRFENVKGKLLNYKNVDYYHHDLANYYEEHYPDSILIGAIRWFSNYDVSQFHFDFHSKNFMQTKEGDIIPVDPVVSKEIYDLIMNKKYDRYK
jgi:hypothetical protein